MKQSFLYILFISILGIGCSAIKETSKYQMQDDIYRVSTLKNKRYFAVVTDERITLHPIVKTKEGPKADTTKTSTVYITSNKVESHQTVTFTNRSFDFDVLTILFKYRPSVQGFPPQLNTNFNSAGYIGRRTDLYRVGYDKDALNRYNRTMNHFAYTLGFFLGIGATSMNPFVTNNNLSSEYDGVVLTKGLAGLIGIGNLTFGATIGFDDLLDNNHKVWIYQRKPYVGFSIGLNLN